MARGDAGEINCNSWAIFIGFAVELKVGPGEYKNGLVNPMANIVIIEPSGVSALPNVPNGVPNMMTKITACLLATSLSFLVACESTQTAAKRETIREMQTRYSNAPQSTEPAPPAEGPEPDNLDPNSNPALVPSPLLRQSAMGSL